VSVAIHAIAYGLCNNSLLWQNQLVLTSNAVGDSCGYITDNYK